MSKHQSTQNQHPKGTVQDFPPKPKRPLTVYNIFSALERNFIVQQHQKPSSDPPSDNSQIDPYLATRPERYRDVVLPPNWFKVGMNKVKRRNYKSHGVISFQDLSKTISKRWAEADIETKLYCERIRDAEMEQYRTDLAVYEATYGKDALDAQKRTYNKRPKNDVAAASKNKHVDYDSDVSENESDDSSQPECGMISQHTKAASGLAVGLGQDPYRKVASQQLPPMHNDFGTTYVREGASGKNASSSNSDYGSNLSDYWPYDKEEALKLVGHDSDNILCGEELEKAFDSDE